MADNELYGFDNEADFLRNIRSIIKTEVRRSARNGQQQVAQEILYARVTEVVSSTEVKATQVIWDTEKSPEAGYDDVSSPWIWDTDLVESNDNDYALKNIQTDTVVNIDDVIEVIYYPDKSGTSDYKVRSGGGGSGIIYFEITDSTDENTYTADIYDNAMDRNLIEEDVTVYLKQHVFGVMPNSASGQGLTGYRAGDGNYYATNYAVFYGV